MQAGACLLLLLATAATGAPAAPIAGAFQQIDCDGGGWFEQVLPHPSGRLYGRTDVGGLYRSDDHGDHWEFLSGDLPSMACHLVQGVAVGADPDVVWQAVGASYSREAGDPGRGIWKSSDGGRHWRQVLVNVTFSGNDAQRWGGECIVIQPGSKDLEMWAGSRGEGLYHSEDAGEHWSLSVDDAGQSCFRANPGKPEANVLISGILIYPATAATPEHLWVYGEKGAWLSVDHGRHWTQRISSLERVYRMAQEPDGTTFAAGLASGKNALLRITSPDWSKDVFKLTDLYRKTPARGAPAKGYLAALEYPPSGESHLATVAVLANGDVIAADLFENTCRSTDHGEHFTRMPMTLVGARPAWSTPGVTVIDGGRNSLMEDPSPRPNPADPHYLFLGGGYAPFRSGDGGNTWQYIHQGIGETVAWRAQFDPANPDHVWLPLADLGCTVVKDGGASGKSSGYIAPHFQPPPDSDAPADIVMFSRRLLISIGRVIAPGGEQTEHRARFYQTTDGGATWSKLKTDLSILGKGEVLDAAASPADPADVLVVLAGADGVFRTTNILAETATPKGAKFTKATGLPRFDGGSEFDVRVSLERDPVEANTCYLLLRDRGFYVSTDGGSSWTNRTAELPNPCTSGVLHVDAETRRVWLGLAPDRDSGSGLQWRDFGDAVWHVVEEVQGATEFDVRNGRLALIGRLGGESSDSILYSADAAATWGRISGGAGAAFATAQAVAVDPWHAGTVWISTNGRAISRFQPR